MRLEGANVVNLGFVNQFQTYDITYTGGPGVCNIVDLTIGLHAEFSRQTLVRVGASFPLGADPNRTFDSELLVQLERRF